MGRVRVVAAEAETGAGVEDGGEVAGMVRAMIRGLRFFIHALNASMQARIFIGR